MNKITFSLLSLVALLPACQDAAVTKQTQEIETRVVASITRALADSVDQPATTYVVTTLHTWYQSKVPNTIKLNPKTEGIYTTHAAILKEAARQSARFAQHPGLSPERKTSIAAGYQKLVDASTANITELTNLATSGSSMSEAEQLQYVSTLADKETRQLALVKYYGQRTSSQLARVEQARRDEELKHKAWGY